MASCFGNSSDRSAARVLREPAIALPAAECRPGRSAPWRAMCCAPAAKGARYGASQVLSAFAIIARVTCASTHSQCKAPTPHAARRTARIYSPPPCRSPCRSSRRPATTLIRAATAGRSRRKATKKARGRRPERVVQARQRQFVQAWHAKQRVGARVAAERLCQHRPAVESSDALLLVRQPHFIIRRRHDGLRASPHHVAARLHRPRDKGAHRRIHRPVRRPARALVASDFLCIFLFVSLRGGTQVLIMLMGLRWRYNLTRTLHSLTSRGRRTTASTQRNNLDNVDSLRVRLEHIYQTMLRWSLAASRVHLCWYRRRHLPRHHGVDRVLP